MSAESAKSAGSGTNARSRTPTTEGARRTRDSVLGAALALFNECGTASVTTNHVAERAGISPGNLYYWFSDKKQIVRQLYAQFVGEYDQLWGAVHTEQDETGDTRESGDRGDRRETGDTGDTGGRRDTGERGKSGVLPDLTPDQVLVRLADGAALSRRYAFLARDLLGLLHADPLLAAEYWAVRERRIVEFIALAGVWRATGVIRPLDDQTVTDLVQALWAVAETWLAFAELDGGDNVDADQGSRLLRVVLSPYLSVSSPALEPTQTW